MKVFRLRKPKISKTFLEKRKQMLQFLKNHIWTKKELEEGKKLLNDMKRDGLLEKKGYVEIARKFLTVETFPK